MNNPLQLNRLSIARFVILSLLLIGIYFSTIPWLLNDWAREDYNYGYIIPFVIAYLIWENKDKLALVDSSPSWLGVPIILLGLVIFLVSELAGEAFSQYLSFWVIVPGLSLSLLGWEKIRILLFPYFFGFSMFPPPYFMHNKLTLWLKLISSQIGVWMMQVYGLSAYREGNVIDLGFTQLQVVDACSGLRYLFPLLMMGLLLAYFYKAAWWKKVILVISTVPLTIITNSLRIAMTGVLYEIWGPVVAQDFFHGFSGWMIFIFGLAVLLVEMAVLKKLPGEIRAVVVESRSQPDKFNWFNLFHWSNWLKGKREKQSDSLDSSGSSPSVLPIEPIKQAEQFEPIEPIEPTKPIGPAADGWKALLHPPQFIVAVVLLAGTLAAAHGIEFREKIPAAKSFAEFPEQVGEWQGKRDAMEEKFVKELDLNDYVIVDFVNGAHAVNFYTAYYESQRKGESIHSPETCLPGSGWEFKNAGKAVVPLAAQPGSTVHGSGFSGSTPTAGAGSTGRPADGPTGDRIDAPTITVNRAVMEKGASKQLSYFWFPQRDRVLTNAWELKLYNFWDALTRQRTDGALVRLVTPVYPNETIEDADKRLAAFTKEIVPVLNEFLPK